MPEEVVHLLELVHVKQQQPHPADLLERLFDRAFQPSTFHLLGWISTSAVGLFVARLGMLRFARRVRTLTRHRHGVVVVGNNPRARNVLDTLVANPLLNARVVAVLDDLDNQNAARAISTRDGVPLGRLQDLESHLASGEVDEVLITLPMRSYYAEVKAILDICSEAGIQAQVIRP